MFKAIAALALLALVGCVNVRLNPEVVSASRRSRPPAATTSADPSVPRR